MRLALLLLLVAAGLTWASYMLDRLGAVREEPVVAAGRTQSPSVTPTKAEISAPDATPLAQAPLFRGAQAPEDRTKPKPGEQLTLTGIAGPDGARVAYVRDAADGSVRAIRVGNSVGASSAVSIEDNCLHLQRGRTRRALCL